MHTVYDSKVHPSSKLNYRSRHITRSFTPKAKTNPKPSQTKPTVHDSSPNRLADDSEIIMARMLLANRKFSKYFEINQKIDQSLLNTH